MAKNIIFCADGTWNGPGNADIDTKDATTNVFKLFLNLGGTDAASTTLLEKEQERVLQDAAGETAQIAKYLHGVGDSDNFLVRLLGGSLGAGLITRIVRGYTFVSRNYRPGDRIILIGFSRGAYTARALAGLIAAKGVLDASKLDASKTDEENKKAAYRLGTAVWYDYRRAALKTRRGLLGRLQELVTDLPGFVSRPPKADLLCPAEIEAIGVWDTVGALGIPTYNVTLDRMDLFQFADTKLSGVVKNGYHAVAIDELRKDFTPTAWDTDPRVRQVLFPGAHSDVGGGYPREKNESGLSDGALAWMMARLRDHGVRFNKTLTVEPKPDHLAPSHQPWKSKVFLTGPREFPMDLLLSDSAVKRLKAGEAPDEPGGPLRPYSPVSLKAYWVDGKLAPGVAVG